MDKNEARKYFDALDENSDWRSTDGVVTIPKHLFMNLLDALGAAAERDDEPARAEPAAATQPTTRDEVRLIEAVRKAASTYDYDKVTTAHRNIGRLDALARHYGHEVDLQTVDALEHTLVGFDTSTRRIISALKEFDDAR